MRQSTEDRMQGAARQASGKIKQETGRVTRHRRMQAEGFVEKNAGKAQRSLGRVEKRQEDRKRRSGRR